MKFQVSTACRFSAIAGLIAIASAFMVYAPAPRSAAIPGMTFKLKLTLKHTPTSGQGRRAVTLLGHGQFGGGMGRVDIDTVSLNETVNGMPTRHFRIIANAIYPVGSRQVTQRVVIEQWLATIPVNIVNPFGSRIRGLPDLPTTKGDYRAFLNTLAAANRVFGEAVAVRTVTMTSYGYGSGMGEDYNQTVELFDLKQGDIDETLFQLGAEYTRKPPVADSGGKTPAPPAKKPPTT